MKTISYKTIERFAKKIEKENLAKNGTSLSYNSMLNDVRILCVHNDSNVVDVEDNWKYNLNKHRNVIPK